MQTGLEAVADISPTDKKIDGGMRSLLSTALQIITLPSVIFLDEPTAGTVRHRLSYIVYNYNCDIYSL